MLVQSRNPADPSEVVFEVECSLGGVDSAIANARTAARSWAQTPFEERARLLRGWQARVQVEAETLARLITREMGKTLAEARLEVKSIIEKVDISLRQEVIARTATWGFEATPTRRAECRFVPYGVMAVIGPFNFPAHLPAGHFVPALLAGNCVVFKPSEKAPAVGDLIGRLMAGIGLPIGVFSVVQGGADVASKLVSHLGIDGILFTGSWEVGRRIMHACIETPSRMLALEMGGNSPCVVMPSANLRQAVIECARSAFVTTGQRCTCARRIIVDRRIMPQFRSALLQVAKSVVVGAPDSDEPVFMGPLINEAAVEALFQLQGELEGRGGDILLPARRLERRGYFVTPAVVELDRFRQGEEREAFVPLVQIAAAEGLDHAIEQARATRFGLAASIFTNEESEWDEFRSLVRAGCVNRNTGTAGASSRLPFGGFGFSGNNRPAGSASVDYCAAPIASIVESGSDAALPLGMKLEPSWLTP